MNSFEVIKKALSVAGTGSLENYLPEPLALEVIQNIREISVCRRLFRSFFQKSRTYTKAKKTSGLNAYHIPDGVTGTLSTYTTGKVQWIAKKLMSFTMVDEEAVEDSQPDVVSDIFLDFSEAVSEAEELAFLTGDTSHLATAPTPDSATAANWYIYDPRTMFDGIFTVTGTADAATPVNASSAAIDVDMINEGIYNLGKYGRNRRRLVGLLPSVQAAAIRQDSSFKNASVTGQMLASFLTGLGSAGEGEGKLFGYVTDIYGVPFYEAPNGTASKVAILDKTSPVIGDRRMIKIKSTEVIEADQRKYVVSERVAFNYERRDAMVEIKNLKTTL